MGAWVYGCMGAWVCAWVGAWTHGYMGECMGDEVHRLLGGWATLTSSRGYFQLSEDEQREAVKGQVGDTNMQEHGRK